MTHRGRGFPIGSWTCPSGNNCVGTLAKRDGFYSLALAWDSPPPLEPVDEVYYFGVIRPELTARVREYLELTGPAVVITL
jgi:hypothetical protein